jgi:hypothetical protein
VNCSALKEVGAYPARQTRNHFLDSQTMNLNEIVRAIDARKHEQGSPARLTGENPFTPRFRDSRLQSGITRFQSQGTET